MGGNGSGFASREEYWDATDEILATLCQHNGHEIKAFVVLTDAELDTYASNVSRDMLEYIAVIAILKPNVFQDALRETSVGCYLH